MDYDAYIEKSIQLEDHLTYLEKSGVHYTDPEYSKIWDELYELEQKEGLGISDDYDIFSAVKVVEDEDDIE